MATPRPRLLLGAAVLLLLLLVLVLVVVVVVSMTAGPADCGVPDCSFVGGCHTAHSVTCDLKGRSHGEIDITSLNLPANVREIVISNAVRIELDESVLDEHRSLRSIKLLNIGTVMMRKTFGPSSVLQDVLLENIADLTTEGPVFQGSVTTLVFRNVTMERCQYGTFGSHIGTLSLLSVKLNKIENGCAVATGGWKGLTVRSCDIGSVARFGFQGGIKQVVIDDSDIDVLNKKGFDLRVSSFSLNHCLIDELKEDAFNVVADNSISLEWSIIRKLQKDALRCLEKNGANTLTSFSRLFVSNHAKDTSLSVDGKKVLLFEHVLDSPCTSHEQECVWELVYEGDQRHSNLSNADRRFLFQLLHRKHCQEQSSAFKSADFRSPCCLDGSAESPVGASDDLLSLLLSLTGAVILLLLISVLVFTIWRHKGICYQFRYRGKARMIRGTADGVALPQDPEVKKTHVNCRWSTAIDHELPECCDAMLPASSQSEKMTGSYAEVLLDMPTTANTETRHQFAAGSPLYAEVAQDMGKNHKAGHQDQLGGGIPLYAEVYKYKKRNSGTDQSGSGGGFPAYAMVAKDEKRNPETSRQAGTNGGFPIYAEVSKDKTRKPAVSHQAGANGGFPVYAKVFKGKKANPETSRQVGTSGGQLRVG